ncbi:MAG: HAMP domain-containing histidine kinase [Verrucomicrobiales bacterium]|nr:HAMP domain-containing histidine kinase [Verrucomicrobiales bacterium]
MSEMRARLPLGTKILTGLGLNAVLLAAAFAVVFAVQVRINPGWLLAGRAGQRLQATAQLLVGDLSLATPDTVTAVLDRYREAYDMDLRLFDNAGRAIAGPAEPLPGPVLAFVGRQRGPFAGRGPRGPAATNPQRTAGEFPRGPRGKGQPPFQEPFPRFVVRAGEPAAYWVVIHLPAIGEFRPLTLVLRSESLWSGALLFDVKPWLAAAAGAFALSGLFWYPLARGITRDIGRMMRGTEAIASGRFDSRLGLRRTDELGRLADAIDQMAGRLDGFVAGQKRFLGDAAHELCSPLARMQTAVAILESRHPAESEPYLADLREELDEMATLVHEFLAFSRATHGRAIQLQATDVRSVARRAWDREAPAGTPLELDIPEGLEVRADAALLQRALANLVRNAVRYAGTAQPITLAARLEDDGTAAWISVADQGPGVNDADIPRLFEPFYRPEPSRSRELGGVGLGLAIVKTCVEACDGTVAARNRRPQGFEVTLRLRPARAAERS